MVKILVVSPLQPHYNISVRIEYVSLEGNMERGTFHERDPERILTKKVRFKDTLEVFLVPTNDDCRFPDREILSRNRNFNQRVLCLESLLKPIHRLKVRFIKETNFENFETYFGNLKSLNENKQIQTTNDSSDDQSDSDEICSSFDDGEQSYSEQDEDDGFEIVFMHDKQTTKDI